MKTTLILYLAFTWVVCRRFDAGAWFTWAWRMAATGLGAAVAEPVDHRGRVGVSPWPAGCGRFVVYRGGESEAFNTDEGIFVIPRLLVPRWSPWKPWRWRRYSAQAAPRRTLVKSAFNAGQVIVAAAWGLAVSRGIAVPSGSLTAGHAPPLVAGGCLCPGQHV